MTSPSGRRDRVEDHINRYVESNGGDGHIWNDVPTLLLTTIGRLSGNPTTTPLIYGKEGDHYVIVASRGGAPRHPQWYLNIRANPDVELQVLADRFSASATTATPEQRPALWEMMSKIWPLYDKYQANAIREIPVVILERKT